MTENTKALTSQEEITVFVERHILTVCALHLASHFCHVLDATHEDAKKIHDRLKDIIEKGRIEADNLVSEKEAELVLNAMQDDLAMREFVVRTMDCEHLDGIFTIIQSIMHTPAIDLTTFLSDLPEEPDSSDGPILH